MRYRPLGRTGQFVSEICLGTMTFHGGAGFWRNVGTVDQAGATALVARALEAGVNFIDTADVYSEGGSEILLGQALVDLKSRARRRDRRDESARPHRSRAPTPSVSPEGISCDQIAASLKRMKLDYVDLYQIHGFDPVTPIEETMRALDDCVARGLVRTIGCSNLAAWQIMKAQGIAERRGFARFETVQAYYTIAGRELEREILPMVEDQGMGVMVWSPLAGGFLSGKFTREGVKSNDARRVAFDFPPVDKERGYDIIDAMRPIAEAHDVVGRARRARLAFDPAGRDERHHRRENDRAVERQSRCERLRCRPRSSRRLIKSAPCGRNILAGCWSDSAGSCTDSTA